MNNCLYQTVANKNKQDIEKNAPFQCTRSDAWLGKGYYFWDTFIEVAKQWGECAYKNNYIICKTQVVCLENEILDFYGNTSQINDLKEITLILEEHYKKKANNTFCY